MSLSANRANGSPSGQLALPFARQTAMQDVSAHTSFNIPVEFSAIGKLTKLAPDIESVLLAAWQTLLWRFSDQSDVVVAFIDNRVQGPAVGAVQSPMTTLSANVSPDTPFSEVLVKAQESKAHAAANDTNGRAEVNVGFVIQPAGSSSTPLQYPSRLRVVLRVQTGGQTCAIDLLYDAQYLPREAAERMGRGYSTLLSSVSADPNGPADALPMLSPEDYEEVVKAFNQSAVPYPDKCVHELFEDQVRRTPGNTALRFHEQTFTYEELNARANQLAHFLRKHGVAANVPVALFVERSAEMIVGLLAILKAGGCYVPLVHDDPQARLAYLLSETKAPIVLTSRNLAGRLPQFGGELVFFDQSFADEPVTSPENRTKSSDLVCVIYTSGSTGAPKGVAARHSNLANYIQFIREKLGLSQYPQGLHFATVSTLSAILGNTSVFGSLMSGGCLHVIDYETAMTPNLFADYVAKHPIDVIKITPSQLGSLLSGAEGKTVLPRKCLVIGGEKFTWELLHQIRANGSCQVMNHYGPTETMGCCTFVVDDHQFDETWKPATVPLGRPMSNQQLYIVDRYLHAVPVGVPGELCMSGAGLTDGYFNQPQQTAEKFVRNPFSQDPSARLYRTGDLARFLPDGNIEFLGRIDHQVKIRGFRVEPAEVEASVKRHPDVKQVVIVPEDGPDGEKILAAYIVPTKQLSSVALRAFLREQLPDYMVPSRMLMLDTLPLNRNGKIDLPLLAGLKEEDYNPVSDFIGPRNPTEERLAEIWSEVLQKDRISVHDDFFELGGHSLFAIQIISRIRNAFRVQLPLFSFLEAPTIADVALKIADCPVTETEEEEMERLLRELDGISDAEAEKLLASEKGKGEAVGGGTAE
jgi:amino acid adenylation domain-containing protein